MPLKSLWVVSFSLFQQMLLLSILCFCNFLVWFSYNIYLCFGIISIISRVCKTLRGSSDDIGWLQHTPGMAPVKDGTPRFLELLAGIR